MARKKTDNEIEHLREMPESRKPHGAPSGQLDEPTNDTEAGRSIVANPTDASKMAMMNTVVDALSRMDKMDLSYLLQQVLDTVGRENAPVDDRMTAQNRRSIEPRDSALNAITPNLVSMAKEDLDDIFKESELSEDAREKISTLFEAAVNVRVKAIQAEMEDDYERQMNEEIRRVTDEIVENLDDYVSHVAQEWLEENRIAVQSSLKTELTEDFIQGLFNLFSEHYVNIPDDQVDVVERLCEKNERLERELDEEYKIRVEMTKELKEHNRRLMIEQACYGLTLPQRERVRELCEDLEYTDEAEFERKLAHVTETVKSDELRGKKTTDLWETYDGAEHEQPATDDPVTRVVDQSQRPDRMQQYYDALSRLSQSKYVGAGR